MKDLTKRHLVRTMFTVGMLLLSLAAAAPAQIGGICSTFSVAGDWGHTYTGTLVLQTGAVPVAAAGRVTLDADGNLSGTQTSSTGGKVTQDTVKGTLKVNPDCTGTLTINIYDQSGNLLRKAVWASVLVDNEREMRLILTSLVLPDGTSLPPVTTMTVAKLFPSR